MSFICLCIYFKNLHITDENKKYFLFQAKKMGLFCNNKNKKGDSKMRLQTDQELKQNSKLFECKTFNAETYMNVQHLM